MALIDENDSKVEDPLVIVGLGQLGGRGAHQVCKLELPVRKTGEFKLGKGTQVKSRLCWRKDVSWGSGGKKDWGRARGAAGRRGGRQCAGHSSLEGLDQRRHNMRRSEVADDHGLHV